MGLTREQQYILFALGACMEKVDSYCAGKPIAINIPKYAFIELAERAGMVHKQPRALYRNLECLEKQRLISYDKKILSLTKKGKNAYNDLKAKILPYVRILGLVKESNILDYTKKARTVLMD